MTMEVRRLARDRLAQLAISMRPDHVANSAA
jgi:hypothetical protein